MSTIKFQLQRQHQRFLYLNSVSVLTNKNRKHFEQNFKFVAWVMPNGWDLGCWGSKTLALGFAMVLH